MNNDRFALDPSLDLSAVANLLPFTYTGADLYALCSDAMLKAITRSARSVDARVSAINAERATQNPAKPHITIAQYFDYHATAADTSVVVTQEDFVAAQRELVPSVSAEEIGHYERVRREFEGGKERDGNSAREQGQPKGQGKPSLEDVEAFQQKMIEQMLSNGLHDGSIAKGGRGGKGKSRGGPFGMNMGSGITGTGKENGRSAVRSADDSEDDMVIRTDHLNLNGSGHGHREESRSRGKGKAKSRAHQDFGDAAADDEDMYA